MQPVILGSLLGVAVGIINFKFLFKVAHKVIDMEARKAGIIVMTSYFVRIILYGGVIIWSVLSDSINALATGGGLLATGLFFTAWYSRKGKSGTKPAEKS